MKRMHGTVALVWAALAVAVPLAAQSPIRYDVRFPNAVHHEATVTLTVTDAPDPLELAMSRSSPGRYALHEFAKNVYAVRAEDGTGQPLEVRRVTPHRWDVAGHGGTVRITYTLYGDHADGTYTGIDASHAHLNMPATFMFARQLQDRPLAVRFQVPEGSGWRVATQLVPSRPEDAANPAQSFTAPDLQYFMDSPTELSPFTLREWTAASGEHEYTIRLAVHHLGTDADVDRFAAMAARVVREEAAVYGELPAFDHGTYTFISDYLPWVFGDGMEHRNSTILVSRGELAGDGAARLLGTVAHEFFHAWNMERLRAAELEPFDFEHEDMTSTLWFGEGFTSYYGGLAMERAGFRDRESFFRNMAGALTFVLKSPARRFRGPAAMSRQAPFVDAASWVDDTNDENTFISYYTYGMVLALGLDLELRTRFDTTLDDYMRAAWRQYGATGRPYTLEDLQAVLADVTGDAGFADDWFRRMVYSSQVPDYERLLAAAGLVLRPADPTAAWLGAASLDDGDDGGAFLASSPWIGDPLYSAGLDSGDLILSLDGRPVTSADDVADILDRHAPGDAVAITYGQRGVRRRGTVVLGADPGLEIVPLEATGEQPTADQLGLRAAWLDTRVATH